MRTAAATKTVRVRGGTFTIQGLGADDAYFSSIEDAFEPDFVALAEALVLEDYVCLDIGANIGMKSLALAQLARKGRVIAVEAGPAVQAVLRANVGNSGLGNITCVHAAVAEQEGELRFSENSAFGHVREDGIAVPATTIGRLVADHGLQRLDFVKIDVEGYEFPILRGGLETLKKHNPLVLFELNLWCQLDVGRVNPIELLEWTLAHFEHVFLVQSPGPHRFALERVSDPGIIRQLMLEARVVTDLLVTNAPERLVPSLDTHLEEIGRLSRELSEARRQLERLQRERDSGLAEVASLYRSSSWRVTAPLRRIASMLPGFGAERTAAATPARNQSQPRT